jgi:SAM-dependent methyltransferase
VLERSRGALGKRVDEIAPVGPVVDVGAGDGTLVRALVAAGREANGLERGDGELAALSNPVAAVVFWHSLEHLRAPRAAVRAAARLLVSGGVVFIAVPNASSLQAQVFGDEWLALDLPRHLVHLPARTLLDGLAGDGWKLERVSYTRGGQTVFGWLHGLVGRLPGSLDLYQSIRSAQARSHPVSWRQRALALAAATVLLPIALACAAVECLLRRGGTVYVEARRV